MPQAVELVLKPSSRAHHVLFWLHALPLVLLPIAMESSPIMLCVAAGIGLSWVWLRRHPAFGYGPRALLRIACDAEARWSAQSRDGKRLDVELLGDSYVQSWIIVLNFRDANGRRRTRVLLGDETTPEAFRRLRVRLAAGISKPSQTETPT
ncbi:MAG: protein YgfX [Panacagrimonas sp.]